MKIALRAALLALSTPLPAFAGVLIVDPGGAQGYAHIQAAIDAAEDGDVILVRSGDYGGFTLHQRSLAVLADVNAKVKVTGSVIVTDTPQDGVVLLGGLELQGQNWTAGPAGQVALWIADCPGFVRVESCTITGGAGVILSACGATPGGPGCVVEDSARVAFSDCTLWGGMGGGDILSTCIGGAGGRGLRAEASELALYDCSVLGGQGGWADVYSSGTVGGMGGAGSELLGTEMLASNTSFRGGSGHTGFSGGDGGAGLLVQTGAEAHLLDCLLQGGDGGPGDQGPDGDPGPPSAGNGTISMLAGQARRFSAATLASDAGSVSVEVEGASGDSIWILASSAPAHALALPLSGAWLAGRPVFLPKAPAAVLGPTGKASVTLHLPDLPLGLPSRSLFLQGFAVDASGKTTLGSPLHLSLLNCEELLPDCNATGAFDSCDLLAGGSVDCNQNSVPDECEADCNQNGVADGCDIESGTSEDFNHNGIPDECEPQGLTWHVDAAAPPGGNGSPQSPFASLAEAIAPSLGGYTILVRDGLYTGPLNRNLSFGGRDLALRSLNGPSACILDCGDLGTGFLIQDGESTASSIEGFTIRNGKTFLWGGGIRLNGAQTSIRNCVIEDCNAAQGGGVDLTNSGAEVVDCRFVGNVASKGGGLSVHGAPQGAAPRVSWCSFLYNSAAAGTGGEGGGIYVETETGILLTHLTLIGNQSTNWGGAVQIRSSAAAIDHCLAAGNSASLGSSISSLFSHLFVRDVTFADNAASTQSSVYAVNSGLLRELRLTNCVLWDDPAANGPLVEAASWLLNVSIERCDVRGGQASVLVAPGSTLIWGAGNLNLDPLFQDPDGPDDDPLTLADNDYRLGPLSPCADAGDNGLVLPDFFDLDGDGNTAELTPYDLDGNPRFVEDPAVPNTGAGTPPLVDLGAWERQ